MSPEEARPARTCCPTCFAVFRGGFLRCPRDGDQLAPSDDDPLVGTVLAERYQIESVIGEGGIGRVYRARHVRMSRRYAIKVPFGELAYDVKVRARFMQEAEATSRVSHPNVVGVVDVGESAQGLLYMAMDLAEGENLAEVIHHHAPLPRERVISLARQIAEGLGHAHDRGLIHRDLKPENVIVVREDGDERPRIVDFGIAILGGGDVGTDPTRLTTEGIVLGTPHYMAPEQATNQAIDQRTDLFALGLVIYEMLCGLLPFDGNAVEVARKNLGSNPPRITMRVPGLIVDRHLEALAFWLMEKRPEDRPQRAAEVVEVLRLIETDPGAASARLALGEVEEIVDLPAPKRASKPPRAPTPPPVPQVPQVPVAESALAMPEQARVYETDSFADRVEQRSRTWIWVVAALALIALIAILLIATRSDDTRPPPVVAAAAPDAAPPVRATVPPDAAPPAPPPTPIDASVKHPDAGPHRPPPPPHHNTTPIVHPATTPDAGVAKPTAPVTSATLTALYNQVGEKLNALVGAKGAAAVANFKQRYSQVPYLEAIRKPELRDEAMQKLRALSHDLAALR